jgi:hypothetical protein
MHTHTQKPVICIKRSVLNILTCANSDSYIVLHSTLHSTQSLKCTLHVHVHWATWSLTDLGWIHCIPVSSSFGVLFF